MRLFSPVASRRLCGAASWCVGCAAPRHVRHVTLALILMGAASGASAEVEIVLVPAPETVIVGRVASVFASARIIDLGAPVEGFELVAVDDSTVILSIDGTEIELGDLAQGSEIEISGQPGVPGTLVASQIRVLS